MDLMSILARCGTREVALFTLKLKAIYILELHFTSFSPKLGENLFLRMLMDHRIVIREFPGPYKTLGTFKPNKIDAKSILESKGFRKCLQLFYIAAWTEACSHYAY